MKFERGWAYPEADDFMIHEMKADGTYQRRNALAAIGHCKERRLAIDGGAHVGTWSRLLSNAFERVLAFEPSPDTFEALAWNMREFNCDNVEIRRAALGKTAGRASMSLAGFPRGEAQRNTGARFVHDATGDATDADIITIDSLDLRDLDLLKMDVEGSEVDALAGASATLQRCRPVVLFEDKGLWKRYGYKRAAPHAFLAALGARQYERVGCDEIWGW